MGSKMKNAPIYFAIAQVRFNPILSLETYLPEIQEKFRKAGYPGFKKTFSMAFNLAPISEGDATPEQIPSVQKASRYVFSNLNESAGFILEQNALSFQTTDYDTYNTFSNDLFQGLEFLHQTVNLSFSERVGIRFLDVVKPLDSESISQYLIPEVLGLYGRLEGDTINSFSESMNRIKIGSLISRIILQDAPLGFPPDLQPIGIQIAPRFAKINGAHAVIDTDAFYDTREAFKLNEIKNHLGILHDEITKIFRTVATEYALNTWK